MLIDVKNPGALQCRQTREQSKCAGTSCAHFRYVGFKVDPAFIEAVRKAAIELNDKNPSRTASITAVNENRAKYGLPVMPTVGYCGLAGPLEFTTPPSATPKRAKTPDPLDDDDDV